MNPLQKLFSIYHLFVNSLICLVFVLQILWPEKVSLRKILEWTGCRTESLPLLFRSTLPKTDWVKCPWIKSSVYRFYRRHHAADTRNAQLNPPCLVTDDGRTRGLPIRSHGYIKTGRLIVVRNGGSCSRCYVASGLSVWKSLPSAGLAVRHHVIYYYNNCTMLRNEWWA